MKTEEEARQCWCPFARAAYPAGSTRMRPDLGKDIGEHLDITVVGNRPVEANSQCIASECMAWCKEWDYGKDADPDQKKGYCGLAGKP